MKFQRSRRRVSIETTGLVGGGSCDMTPGASSSTDAVLIVTAGRRDCAIPVRCVTETMRPLPLESIAGAPSAVLGVAVIRGVAAPVVDLQALLGDSDARVPHGRFVALKVGQRCAALAVTSVVGVRGIEQARMAELPPLLRDSEAGLVEAISVSDAQLLLVLRAARLVPEGVGLA